MQAIQELRALKASLEAERARQQVWVWVWVCGWVCGVGLAERARQQKELRVLEESIKVERARQEQQRRAQEAEFLTQQQLREQVLSSLLAAMVLTLLAALCLLRWSSGLRGHSC